MSKIDQIVTDLSNDPTLLEKLGKNPKAFINRYELKPEEIAQLGEALDKSGLLNQLKSKLEPMPWVLCIQSVFTHCK
jgi:hypothetical protein